MQQRVKEETHRSSEILAFLEKGENLMKEDQKT